MRHRWQTTSVWALVAYFGALSLLGPGWHCAFDAHVHCAFGAHVRCAFDTHLHCGAEHSASACRHGHAPATPAKGTSPAGNADDASNAAHPRLVALPDAHDCPLCQFFGIAQWSGGYSANESAQPSAAFRTPAPASPRLTFINRYQSRGPPCGASCI